MYQNVFQGLTSLTPANQNCSCKKLSQNIFSGISIVSFLLAKADKSIFVRIICSPGESLTALPFFFFFFQFIHLTLGVSPPLSPRQMSHIKSVCVCVRGSVLWFAEWTQQMMTGPQAGQRWPRTHSLREVTTSFISAHGCLASRQPLINSLSLSVCLPVSLPLFFSV